MSLLSEKPNLRGKVVLPVHLHLSNFPHKILQDLQAGLLGMRHELLPILGENVRIYLILRVSMNGEVVTIALEHVVFEVVVGDIGESGLIMELEGEPGGLHLRHHGSSSADLVKTEEAGSTEHFLGLGQNIFISLIMVEEDYELGARPFDLDSVLYLDEALPLDLIEDLAS